MMSEQRNVRTDQLLTPNKVHVEPDTQPCNKSCRTIALIDGFYLCKLSKSECEHAFPYGSSYLCRSSDRHKYSRRA